MLSSSTGHPRAENGNLHTRVQSNNFLTLTAPAKSYPVQSPQTTSHSEPHASHQTRTNAPLRITVSPNCALESAQAGVPSGGLHSSQYANVNASRRVSGHQTHLNLPGASSPPISPHTASAEARSVGLRRSSSGRFSPRLFAFASKSNSDGNGGERGAQNQVFSFGEQVATNVSSDNVLDHLSSSIRSNPGADQSLKPQRSNDAASSTEVAPPPAEEPLSAEQVVEYEPTANTWWDVFVRWYVLVMYSNAILINTCVWNTWGPISNVAIVLFGWNDAIIALLTDIGSLAFFIIGIPAAWFIAKRGTRRLAI